MKKDLSSTSKGFGTFKGVFVPSILTILGIIMYLRMGWVVGQVGLTGSIIIITLSSAITFLTTLSISATATNMKIEGGGAYFMISRSFGVEAGAAIGIPLFIAQVLGISFYLSGFSESVYHLFPIASPQIIGTAGLAALAILAYKSTDVALKTQTAILIVILLSLLSFFMGDTPAPSEAAVKTATSSTSFWVVFAIFFPAVTGIEAGIAMSGDLKNPGRSLPWGTLGAVIVGYVVYVSIAIFLGVKVPLDILKSDSMIMLSVAKYSHLIVLGIWGASLSSALGAILGAPRTLQALGIDKVLPTSNLKFCEVFTYACALAGIWLGDLDVIAPVLSMFFLTSYGALNLAAALEGSISNPSWRPSFRTPWILSLIGALGCLATMLMIDAGSAFLAMILCSLIYFVMSKKEQKSRWSDIRYAMMLSLARFAVYALARLKVDARSWRPNLLVLSGSINERWYMIELADAITHGKGFLTVVNILTAKHKLEETRIQSLEKSLALHLKKKGIPAFVEVCTADDLVSGAQAFISSHGLGPLVPNTVVLGETEEEEKFEGFVRLISTISNLRRNLIILREGIYVEPNYRFLKKPQKTIDVWWNRGLNAGLMLALGYMIQSSPEWRGAILNLKSVVGSEAQKDGALEYMKDFVLKGRIDAIVSVFVNSNDVFETIRKESRKSHLIFIGLKPIAGVEMPTYIEYYKNMLLRTKGMPPVVLTLASEDVKFKEIFS